MGDVLWHQQPWQRSGALHTTSGCYCWPCALHCALALHTAALLSLLTSFKLVDPSEIQQHKQVNSNIEGESLVVGNEYIRDPAVQSLRIPRDSGDDGPKVKPGGKKKIKKQKKEKKGRGKKKASIQEKPNRVSKKIKNTKNNNRSSNIGSNKKGKLKDGRIEKKQKKNSKETKDKKTNAKDGQKKSSRKAAKGDNPKKKGKGKQKKKKKKKKKKKS